MSDYPPTPSYGANSWSRDQPIPPYLPPTYPNQYLQPNDGHPARPPMASNYDTSMSAYGYNGSIPSFSATAVASGVPPLPIFQGWNQDSIPLPPYISPQNAPQYAEYNDNSHHNTQYFPPVEPQLYQQNTQAARPFDNGELSEGEFEDSNVPGNTAPVSYGMNQYQGNGGYVDTAHRAVYSKSQEFSPAQGSHPGIDYNYSRVSPQVRRQQSDSYSPYVSPREPDQEEQSQANQNYSLYAPTHTPEHNNGTPQNQYGWMQNGTDSPHSNSRTNGYPAPKSVETPSATAPPVQPGLSQAATPLANKLAESRKKAQGAILNLWPLEVRFQNYIDEGFDERLVGRLFDDLGISRVPSKSISGINGAQNLADTQKPPANVSQVPNQLENLVPRTSNWMAGDGVQSPKQGSGPQHLKLSAEGNAKQLPSNSDAANISTSPSTNAPTVAAPTKSTPATEKERTLQMKMEALRKSREERAQKAAAKNNAKPATVPVTVPVPQPEPPKPTSVAKASSSPSTSPLPITQHQSPSRQMPSNPSPQTSGPLQQAPVIPGLFLASTAASPAPSSTPYSTTQVNQRKRPVAADFDTPTIVANPFKRPFGQSRNEQPLVIDVSDEEPDSDDEDVAMDLESQADQESPVQQATKMSEQRTAAIQNLPPLSNFPTHTPFTPPPNASATNTPPIAQVVPKGSLGRPDVLLAKESEIEQLKKKIAEAEARKKAKRTPSGIRTPQAIDTNYTDSKANDTDDIASKVAASVEIQNLVGIAENEVSSDQQRLADTQAAELKRNEAERKRLRREKIATDLPRVDAEVQENQTKLEQLRAEVAKIEADVEKKLEDKRKMAEEMERLGQETEDQLQTQKDKLKDLASEETISPVGFSRQSSLPTVEGATRANKMPVLTSGQDRPSEPVPAQLDTSTENSVSDIDEESQQASNTSVSLNGDLCRIENPPAPVTDPVKDDHKVDIVTDHVLEAALQEAVRAEADSHSQGASDMDIEDFYAPDPNQLAPDTSIEPTDEKRSPIYSPIFERSDAADGESDNYEPPEAPPQVDKPSIDSPPFSPAPPETISELTPNTTLANDTLQIIDQNGQIEAGELLPQQNGSVPLLCENGGQEKSNETQFFTPYESPLKLFRAYRFHPEFKHTVSGGLRSMTYSHKIDPKKELCRYELAGGICNDPACEFQHFRDIGLPDDAVLTALGSPDEFTGVQREKFREGLKEVLTKLRLRKIRDFDVIAAEIVAHRSKFLGDNSKVLMLEGTSI